jgi:hypothetical protein
VLALGAGIALMVIVGGVLLSKYLGGSLVDRPAGQPDRAVRIVRIASPTPGPMLPTPTTAVGPTTRRQPPRNVDPPVLRNRREVVNAMLRNLDDPPSSAHLDMRATYRAAGVRFGIVGDFDRAGADLQGSYRLTGPAEMRFRMIIKDGIVWMNEGAGWVTRGMGDTIGDLEPITREDIALLRYEGPVMQANRRLYRFRHVKLDWPTVAQLTAPADGVRLRDVELVILVDGHGRVVEQRMRSSGTMVVIGKREPMTMEQEIRYGRFGQNVVITAPLGTWDTPNA